MRLLNAILVSGIMGFLAGSGVTALFGKECNDAHNQASVSKTRNDSLVQADSSPPGQSLEGRHGSTRLPPSLHTGTQAECPSVVPVALGGGESPRSRRANSSSQDDPLLSGDVSNRMAEKLDSDETSDRVDAIIFLSEHGSERARQLVRDIAVSPDEEDPLVRSVAIVGTDWTENFSQLEQLLLDHGGDPDVARAVLNAADLTNVGLAQRERFNRFLLDQMRFTTEPRLTVNMLEYFREKEAHWSEQSLEIVIQSGAVPPEVEAYFSMLEESEAVEEKVDVVGIGAPVRQ